MKSILIIGGGELGINQVKWAKEVGFHVIVTDYNPEAPGFKAADLGIQIAGDDIRGLIAFALQNTEKYNIVAVYCGNDFGLLSVAAVSQVLKIPCLSLEVVVTSMDKVLMKNVWEKANVTTPLSREIYSFSDLQSTAKSFGFPVIVKPLDSSGSRGVSRAENQAGLKPAFDEACRFSKNNRVIVEQFIQGFGCDVNGLFVKDKFYRCGMIDRFFTPPPFCVPLGTLSPTTLSENIQDQVFTLFENAVRALNIDFGPVKGDIILTDNGPYVIEISPRFHGDIDISNTIPLSTGVNPVKAFFKVLYGEKDITEDIKKSQNRVAGYRTVVADAGKIVKVIGEQEVQKIPGVESVLLRKSEGAVIHNLRNNTDVPAYIIASAENQQALEDVFKEALQTIKFEVEK